MKILTLITSLFFLALMEAEAVEIQSIPHRVVADDRTFVREATDKRYSIWTNSELAIAEIFSELGLPQNGIIGLKRGEVFAVFLNDRIEEDLVQISRNTSTNQYFADYADSGIKYRLQRLSEDKKFSHLTAVIFTPSEMPTHLGLRGMITNGLSEKK
jgi:hypothetical protein